jgi:hypothetical protein
MESSVRVHLFPRLRLTQSHTYQSLYLRFDLGVENRVMGKLKKKKTDEREGVHDETSDFL